VPVIAISVITARTAARTSRRPWTRFRLFALRAWNGRQRIIPEMKTIFACLSLLFVGSSLDAQAPEAIRFKDPEGITADPTGLRRDTSDPHTRPGPVYPRGLSPEKVTGATVVAFVIDTTGRVELETASFLNSSRPEFVKAVCDFLPTARFQPFLVNEQKWRVLLVEMFAFNTLAVRDTVSLRAASALAARSQEEFSTEPIGKVVAQLTPLPHCPE
jgi:Gram-negative bacterial TonB protein C-terminal